MTGVSAYTQYYFDKDICIIVILNTESLDQYCLGNGIAAILHNKQAPALYRPKEIFILNCTVWEKIASKGDVKNSKQFIS